jgi:hypothetical protein
MVFPAQDPLLLLLLLLPGEEALLQLAKIGEKPDVVVSALLCAVRTSVTVTFVVQL